ncbi:MAG: hypothetical protein HPY61_13780 [Methanotrichaceae archaeon]|nr:hypothetical protein [Methanotrichaceae archaeon]
MFRKIKDYSEIRSKCQRATVLIGEGLSETKAAQEVGLPKASLMRYLDKGLPDGPIWPQDGPCPGGKTACNHKQSGTRGKPEPAGQRDSQGKFLPGNSVGSQYDRPARQAKAKLEQFAPQAADKLIRTFKNLPSSRPDLILAYSKEILDRGLGKPKQTLDVKETSTHEEYRFIEQIITTGDSDALRAAADLAKRLEEYAREHGGAPQPRAVEIIPPPGKSLFDPGPGDSR